MKVKKAIIAAAGLGTRFLPQTKAMPKEMLPIVDKPIIQMVVEELVEAGIKDIIIVTGYNKRAIEDHFDTPNAELVSVLEAGGKHDKVRDLESIANMANFAFVRQKAPLGNAAPLLDASHLINGDPFIYTWADDLIKASPSRVSQVLKAHEQTGGSIFSCVRATNDEDYDRYGFVAGEPYGERLLKMTAVVEKPGKEKAPSDIYSVGGYVLTPEIVPYLERIKREHKAGEELRIQTAMQLMIDDGHPYYAYEIVDGTYYDAGNKLEYLKTVVDMALAREDMADEFRAFLRQKV